MRKTDAKCLINAPGEPYPAPPCPATPRSSISFLYLTFSCLALRLPYFNLSYLTMSLSYLTQHHYSPAFIIISLCCTLPFPAFLRSVLPALLSLAIPNLSLLLPAIPPSLLLSHKLFPLFFFFLVFLSHRFLCIFLFFIFCFFLHSSLSFFPFLPFPCFYDALPWFSENLTPSPA